MNDDICSHGRPNHQDQIRELREAVGLFAGAMPITPKQAWEEAIAAVRRLASVASTPTTHDPHYDSEGNAVWGDHWTALADDLPCPHCGATDEPWQPASTPTTRITSEPPCGLCGGDHCAEDHG